MSKLENLILNNREMADMKEPRAGHFLRFFRKTGYRRISDKKFSVTRYILIPAASVIIAVILTTVFPGNKNPGLMADLPEELNYVIFYYDSMSDNLMQTIFKQNLIDRNERKRINNDIKDFEAWQMDILEDFRKFPDDDRILNTLIEFHKSKAEMLNEIYTVITTDNETDNIMNKNVSNRDVWQNVLQNSPYKLI